MRSLKFRAWDKDAAKYTDGVGELYVDILEVGTKTYRIEQMCPGRYIIEQYTGLKDKNGKEIYEGDIVKAGGRIYEVAWLEKDGGWFCFTEDDYYTPLYHLEAEVIGNIHEGEEEE